MEFLIVTGLSGAGKSRAMDALEDIGFYCADNIPPKLIPTFYELSRQAKGTLSHVAVVTDIRGGDMFSSLLETLSQMKSDGKDYKLLFLDANDYVLVNRFKETRRKHPLADNCLGSLQQAVRLERDVLRPVKERADYVIDTSLLSPAQLKKRISGLFLGDASDALMIHCISFRV
jgi:RNase adapter protein RapZ